LSDFVVSPLFHNIITIMPKAVTIQKVDGKPGQVYYPLKLIDQPVPNPKDNEVVVKISAAALNHRDLFVRQHLYPAISFEVPLLADACGVVVDAGSSAQKWKGKRVILNPGTGWKDDPDGPESPTGYKIMGGTKSNPLGTLSETFAIDAGELEECPPHLSDAEAAALPLTGLTAWRAVMTKSGNAKPGRNILVTGIGGGVALMALFFGVSAGCNVYVSSGNEEKLKKAKELGATGGVNYKEKDWEKKLRDQLPKDRKYLDAIIDGAGGDIVEKAVKLLKVGLLRILDPHREADERTGRRYYLDLRHDCLSEDAMVNECCYSESRSAWVDYGLAEGVRRHGQVHRIEEDEAYCLTSCKRNRQSGRHQQPVRGHEVFEPVWQACCSDLKRQQ
jgi:NADPH:quinone reductase-like Zn-dependent oxidoreductase